ncbi:hypothetical protein GUITHDRAFT_134187 [Guillardia theta CCMP2712]|uniref:HNH nuclease domain-containing protein n=1 Tax=Guillardia theta (strain CCMP2712) TaxID=905079 RepID=L1JTX2_GUITC|nr:hypothetical protein GUITHDRAFT_134187 [Guillardia theta CCMP2712]EKX51852.1 hypothetical protein GUITHDRAFT_134187 [Guillardia theta CCMP2712]|eukprot:XP_005838832.1 hypothetical protein GUITHDRAFT_134187 [Guillardia theta CCMP2712]
MARLRLALLHVYVIASLSILALPTSGNDLADLFARLTILDGQEQNVATSVNPLAFHPARLFSVRQTCPTPQTCKYPSSMLNKLSTFTGANKAGTSIVIDKKPVDTKTPTLFDSLVMRGFRRVDAELEPQPPTNTNKVLVLNASFEPLSIVSATRALSLLWEGKASMVVDKGKTWKSCGGQHVHIPSVVSLRRYVKVHPKMPPLNRRTVLLRDEGKCQYCGDFAESIDHIIPRAKGGGTTWENVVAACKACNGRKAAFYLKDTNLKLKKQPGPPTWTHDGNHTLAGLRGTSWSQD